MEPHAREVECLDCPRPTPGRDPLRWASQVTLLVIVAPALVVALLVGLVGIGAVAVMQVGRRVAWAFRPVPCGRPGRALLRARRH